MPIYDSSINGQESAITRRYEWWTVEFVLWVIFMGVIQTIWFHPSTWAHYGVVLVCAIVSSLILTVKTVTTQ